MVYERHGHAVYVISVAAELVGVHPQTLRSYEREGLLRPGRTNGGSRRYSDLDVERLRHIIELTNSGLNLEGVRRVLRLEDEVMALREQVLDLQAERDRLHRQYRREIVPLSQVESFSVWRREKP
jgi:MerR family transcriptional regulator, heat shock protein HspR